MRDDHPREAALRFLRDHSVMTLATHGPEGLWAAAVFYANEGFSLYFLSAPDTRHATNLHARPRVAATIQEDTSDWRKVKGIQLEGTCAALEGDEERHAIAVYGTRFPLVADIGSAPAAIARALAGIRWYRLVPNRLYFIDNAKGFGHRDEITLNS